MKIPKTVMIGPHLIRVTREKDLSAKNALLGQANITNCQIRLQTGIEESVMVVTFYHELLHVILDALGEKRLAANEKLIDSLSCLLAQAALSAVCDLAPEENK